MSFTAHPHDPKCVHTVLNLQENQRLEATGKTIALTRWTFGGKVMSLLFNMLSAAAAAKSLQ